MANLIERQRRLYEVGIIRIGEKKTIQRGDKDITFPTSRDTFKLTSTNKGILEEAQKAYGGILQPWEGHPGEFELLTERSTINVIFSTKPEGDQGDMQSLSQWWELWGGNTCNRRCDGCNATVWKDMGRRNAKKEVVLDQAKVPCLCDHDAPGFRDLQKAGKACKLTSRLSVILPDVPAMGLWRLNTGSETFADETAGVLDLIEQLGITGLISMTMTIEFREKRTGEGEATSKFPVVKLEYTPENLLARYVQTVRPQSLGEVPVPAIGATAAPALEQSNAEEAMRQAKLDGAYNFLIEIGMADEQVIEFKTWCQGEGRPWVTLALQMRDLGTVTTVDEFYKGVRNEH